MGSELVAFLYTSKVQRKSKFHFDVAMETGKTKPKKKKPGETGTGTADVWETHQTQPNLIPLLLQTKQNKTKQKQANKQTNPPKKLVIVIWT